MKQYCGSFDGVNIQELDRLQQDCYICDNDSLALYKALNTTQDLPKGSVLLKEHIDGETYWYLLEPEDHQNLKRRGSREYLEACAHELSMITEDYPLEMCRWGVWKPQDCALLEDAPCHILRSLTYKTYTSLERVRLFQDVRSLIEGYYLEFADMSAAQAWIAQQTPSEVEGSPKEQFFVIGTRTNFGEGILPYCNAPRR